MKKVFLAICFVLLSCNLINAKEDKIKVTKQEYLNQLNLIVEEMEKSLEPINFEYSNNYNNYKKEIDAKKDKIKELETKKHKYYSEYSLCDENAQWAEIAKGPCGKYIGKTTFFKGKSGIVYADSSYALNKCLENDKSISTGARKDPCKKHMDNHLNAEKEISNLKKEISKIHAQQEMLGKKRELQLKTLADEFKTKSNELYQDCIKTYPHKSSFFGYCNELSVKLEFN